MDSDGRGFFLRAVNGSSREVGSVQLDTMQRLTGKFQSIDTHIPGTGAFTNAVNWWGSIPLLGQDHGVGTYSFDNAIQARTDIENRSLNVGMTLAIFLN